jgi:hypothetical protein
MSFRYLRMNVIAQRKNRGAEDPEDRQSLSSLMVGYSEPGGSDAREAPLKTTLDSKTFGRTSRRTFHRYSRSILLTCARVLLAMIAFQLWSATVRSQPAVHPGAVDASFNAGDLAPAWLAGIYIQPDSRIVIGNSASITELATFPSPLLRLNPDGEPG